MLLSKKNVNLEATKSKEIGSMSTTVANPNADPTLASLPKAPGSPSNRIALLIRRVMQQTDDLVVVIDYQGKDGSMTRRVLSPIRFVSEDRFLALCLSREEPRQFYLDRCSNVRVDLANNYVMPVALSIL